MTKYKRGEEREEILLSMRMWWKGWGENKLSIGESNELCEGHGKNNYGVWRV